MIQSFKREKKKLKKLNIVFCTDKFLLGINKKFLKHNFLTDIITFQYNEKNSALEGEIYISVERVKGNAEQFNNSFTDELHRVLIHGALHLCGHKDKTRKDKSAIRKDEDFYLSLRKF